MNRDRENHSLITSHYSRWRGDGAGGVLAGVIVVAFCLLLLWHDPLIFWNDDYELSILPVFADVARSWNEGHWPLLSPYSWVCNNLAGEFQYGTFSVFINAAVVLIWKFPLKFSEQAAALSITHLFFLAIGAFLLARDRKCNAALSIFVALVAALNGWIVCWGATDWFGALGAFTWLPWCWWAFERGLWAARTRRPFESGDISPHSKIERRRLLVAALWPVPFVYLLVTGGFPYTVLMLALLICWLSIRTIAETRSIGSILPILLGVALGFGIAAPAWLAIFDYVHGSARETQPVASHWQWIVPWRALPGLVLPCWTVNWADFSSRYLPHSATELACGLVAPSALIAAFIWRARLVVRRLSWELILLLVILILSMVPMFGVFRWSFRWLPFFHLVLAICAAEVLRLRRRLPAASASMLLLIVITVPLALFQTGGDYGPSTTWIYFQVTVIWVLTEWFLPSRRLRDWAPAAVTFAILLGTYFCIPPNCGVPKYNLSQELTKTAPLGPDRLYLSIYPAPEFEYRLERQSGPVGQVVRPGSTSMWGGLRLVNGYSPIRPAGVAKEFKFSIHGEIDAGMAEWLLADWPGLMSSLGIDGIIVAQDIALTPPPQDWDLAFTHEEARVFHRKGEPLARVRSLPWIDSIPDRGFSIAKVSDINDSRNSVSAEIDNSKSDQPALLTFSRPYFNGYVARIGSTKLQVTSYRGFFPTLEVPPRTSGKLVLNYRPWWLLYGGLASVLCLGVFATGIVFAFRTKTERKQSINAG